MQFHDKLEPGFRQIGHGAIRPGRGPLGTMLSLVGGAALLALGFMFSLLILVIVAAAGLLGFAYLWWKTRTLRAQLSGQMQEQMRQAPNPRRDEDDATAEGVIIEGEVLHEKANHRDET